MIDEEIRSRFAGVKLLLMDCDGVLTDGRLYFSAAGEEMKVFHVRDGQGIVSWHKAGFKSGIITGRGGESILRTRAEELGIAYISARSSDKVRDFEAILAEVGVSAEETAFVADDIGDLGLMARVGLPIAVSDAVPQVLAAASYVTKATGGNGAVREVTDMLLAARSKG